MRSRSTANGSAPLWVQGEAGDDDLQDLPVVGGIERVLAQQADGVDHLARRPDGAGIGDRSQLGPAVEQPPAAVGGGLEAVEEPLGDIRIVGAGELEPVQVAPGVEDEGVHRLARKRQEAPAQVLDLLAAVPFVFLGDLREPLSEQRGAGRGRRGRAARNG